MADETKKYLIDIESNIKQYIDELIEAKKKLEDARAAVDDLKNGQFKSRQEIELTNAKLREAQKEYSNAKKVVDLATAANKAEAGSYEQLLRQNQLYQTALKLEGGMIVKNTDGTYKMTEKYIQLSKQAANTKSAIDQFGKGINDNRLNVGNYSAAIEGALGQFAMMPGALGSAATSASMFTRALVAVSPAILAITGGLALLATPFIAFFKWSQEGMDILAQKTSGVKAAITVLKGELINLGKSGVDEASKPGGLLDFFSTLWGWYKKIEMTGLKIISPEGAKIISETANKMSDASKAAQEYTKQEQLLEAEENALIVPRSKSNLALKEARLLYSDTTKSMTERMDALKASIVLENKTTDDEINLNDKKVALLTGRIELLKKEGQDTREQEKALQELIAHGFDLRTESAGREVRDSLRIRELHAEILADEHKRYAAEKELDNISLNSKINSYTSEKELVKLVYEDEIAKTGASYDERERMRKEYEKINNDIDAKKLQDQKQLLKDQLDVNLKAIDTIIQPEETANAEKLKLKAKFDADYALLDANATLKLNQQAFAEETRQRAIIKANQKARFDAQKISARDNVDMLQTLLDQEYIALKNSIEYEKMSKDEKHLADVQYTENTRQLSLMRMDQQLKEYDTIASLAGSMSDLFGKQTVAAKGLSVAQALISTYTAGVKAMAELPLGSGPVLRFLTLAAIIAAGMVQVKNILAVKIPGGGGDTTTSAPTAISSSVPVQRATTQPVGSSVLTQQQLTQPQLNALPNQNYLTADDIARALSKMPAPVVTVEDINAKVKSMNKISVRANI